MHTILFLPLNATTFKGNNPESPMTVYELSTAQTKFVLFPQLAVLNKKTSKKYEKSEESWIESKVYEDQ